MVTAAATRARGARSDAVAALLARGRPPRLELDKELLVQSSPERLPLRSLVLWEKCLFEGLIWNV